MSYRQVSLEYIVCDAPDCEEQTPPSATPWDEAVGWTSPGWSDERMLIVHYCPEHSKETSR